MQSYCAVVQVFLESISTRCRSHGHNCTLCNNTLFADIKHATTCCGMLCTQGPWTPPISTDNWFKCRWKHPYFIFFSVGEACPRTCLIDIEHSIGTSICPLLSKVTPPPIKKSGHGPAYLWNVLPFRAFWNLYLQNVPGHWYFQASADWQQLVWVCLTVMPLNFL